MLFKTLLILTVLAVLFPAVRRRFTRIGWCAYGAFVLFLLVSTISHG
ncbi:hypothetical protein N825_04915 [Skermanella stibiiresistens SB22]|uniref:Uncharacterized protein n=1 Tax=Skermanella stibiiresistens SB22 TaxID=1385369 RepID=W9H163_9PROT|nr:hypothetical protein [Skermanella stibiiresistens]EWY39920.1 hypothetical protein N825_04915 [Skermanella stibiiresistens SB22]